MRFAAGIEYDGSAFEGWQTQPAARTVQDAVEAALARVADHPVPVVCAGRTDAGVHACEQVVHFESGAAREPHNWQLGANAQLPDDVRLQWVVQVADDFHARFSAVARSYRYLILQRDAPSALHRSRATWERRQLDLAAMREAGAVLLGEHDFSAFRAAACQANTAMREVTDLVVSREGELVVVEVRANAFLHHMVRNIVGALLRVGRGDASPDWMAELLASRDRRRADVTAPPQGLYLLRVDYERRFGLPQRAGDILSVPPGS